MKNLILAATAAASLIGTAGLATSASAEPYGYRPVYVEGGYRAPIDRDIGYRYRGYEDRRWEHRRFDRARWVRGGYWRPAYGVEIVEPYRYGLYRAPYGSRWMRADDGARVLIDRRGVIADVVIR